MIAIILFFSFYCILGVHGRSNASQLEEHRERPLSTHRSQWQGWEKIRGSLEREREAESAYECAHPLTGFKKYFSYSLALRL
jgi:hypothetical protein